MSQPRATVEEKIVRWSAVEEKEKETKKVGDGHARPEKKEAKKIEAPKKEKK
ncbi:MAG: hypothetical protein V1936_01150 [Patescibacteria group bacterium]